MVASSEVVIMRVGPAARVSRSRLGASMPALFGVWMTMRSVRN
jgi:hypothetical protein